MHHHAFVVVCLIVLTLVVAQAQAPAPPNPRDVQLIGNRFKPLKYDEMTPPQKTMLENLLSGPRRGAGGPFNALLRSPEMGDLAAKFGASMRYSSSIPPRLNEMAIIITARYWTSHYEWYAHRRAAATAGLKESIILAIAEGKRPTGMQADEEILYNFCTELLNTKQVSDATFKATVAKFGEQGVIDMIGVMGWYNMVSMILNTDRHPLPEGVAQELKPLK